MIRVPVNRGAFHPAHYWGAPPWVFWTNAITNLMMCWAIGFSFWLLLPVALFLSIQLVFLRLRAKGPFYLRFLVRTTFGPIRNLEV
jgi:hypothetical protein